jgi:hypothetical protein
MSSIVIAGDTSGSVTLQAPATAGTTVLTLPSTSGTLAIGSGALVFLSTVTASASATVDFTSGINSTYDVYLIKGSNIVPATDATALIFRTSTDGGVSYASTSGDYKWVYNGRNSFNSVVSDASESATRIDLTAGVSNTGNGVNINLTLVRPSQAAFFNVFWEVGYTAGNGYVATLTGAGQRLAAADVDAVRFLFASGNITSGVFRLYGIANS